MGDAEVKEERHLSKPKDSEAVSTKQWGKKKHESKMHTQASYHPTTRETEFHGGNAAGMIFLEKNKNKIKQAK